MKCVLVDDSGVWVMKKYYITIITKTSVSKRLIWFRISDVDFEEDDYEDSLDDIEEITTDLDEEDEETSSLP